MIEKHLISVIIPVYGVEAYLDRCVESVVNQTYNNLQIILVDDGSPDHCPAMCDAWAEKDCRIKVIHKENGGLSDARNAGLAQASGDYICFVDSDDWLDLRFIDILHRTAIENDCQISECEYIITSGPVPDVDIAGSTTVYTIENAMEQHLRDKCFRQVVWNKLYRREVISVPFEKGKYHEDVFWTYQIIANCQHLAHVEAPLYCYFQREGSIMGQAYSLKRLDAVEAAVQRCKFVAERFPNLAGLAQGQLVCSCMYHYQCILQNPDLDPNGSHRKWLHKQVLQTDNQWSMDSHFLKKQLLWLKLYHRIPKITCHIRNMLKIGV